jgi:hypothetical protein
LQHEVRANAKKAALLGVLLLVGCCIWVPMLVRAIGGSKPVAIAVPVAPVVANNSSIPIPSGNPVEPEAKPSEFWSKLAATLSDDPLMNTADVQAMTRNPFQEVEIPEPLPVLFADEPVIVVVPTPPAEVAATVPPRDPLPEKIEEEPVRLVLRSTIIGRNRRAAMINGQLYQVGQSFEAQGRQFRLTTVESNRAVLTSGEQTIELIMSRPQLKDVLTRNDATFPSRP